MNALLCRAQWHVVMLTLFRRVANLKTTPTPFKLSNTPSTKLTLYFAKRIFIISIDGMCIVIIEKEESSL